MTSGSTAAPKRIPYSRRRLRAWSMTFVDAFARAYWALSIRRTSLYVLASMDPDDSLTAMLLAERRLPRYPGYLAALAAKVDTARIRGSGLRIAYDAMFGTGLSAPLTGLHETVAQDLNSVDVPVVAVDLPSGLSVAVAHPVG